MSNLTKNTEDSCSQKYTTTLVFYAFVIFEGLWTDLVVFIFKRIYIIMYIYKYIVSIAHGAHCAALEQYNLPQQQG